MGNFPRQEIEATTTSIFMSPRDPRSILQLETPQHRWHGSGLVKVSLYCILAGFYLMTRFSLEFFRAHVVHGEVQLIKSWTYRSDSSLVLVINHQLLFHKTMLITEITVITVISLSSDRASGQSTFLYGQILSLKTLSRNHFLQTII